MTTLIENTRTILTIALTLLSLLTAIVAMLVKGKKTELMNFGYDLIIMLAGSLITVGTFTVIYQLLIVKIKSLLGFYELAKLSDSQPRKYKKLLTHLTWISIVGDFISFVLEVFAQIKL